MVISSFYETNPTIIIQFLYFVKQAYNLIFTVLKVPFYLLIHTLFNVDI